MKQQTKPKPKTIPKIFSTHTLFCADCETTFFEAAAYIYFLVAKDQAIREHIRTCEGGKLNDTED